MQIENIILSQRAESATEELLNYLRGLTVRGSAEDPFLGLKQIRDSINREEVPMTTAQALSVLSEFIDESEDYYKETGKIRAYGTEEQKTFASARPEIYDVMDEQ